MQHFKALLHDEAGTLALGAALVRTLTPGLTIFLNLTRLKPVIRNSSSLDATIVSAIIFN